MLMLIPKKTLQALAVCKWEHKGQFLFYYSSFSGDVRKCASIATMIRAVGYILTVTGLVNAANADESVHPYLQPMSFALVEDMKRVGIETDVDVLCEMTSAQVMEQQKLFMHIGNQIPVKHK